MRVLRAIIEVAVLAMFHPRQEFSLRGSIALQLVRDDHSRNILAALEQLVEELLGRMLIPPMLDQEIQAMTVLIHGPPQIVARATDREEDLIQMPFVARPGSSAMELSRILLPELAAPLPDGLIRHDHAAGEQQLFDIPVAQAKSRIEPHAVASDFSVKAVILVSLRSDGRGHTWPPICVSTPD